MKKLILIVLALILSTQVMYSQNDYAKQRVEAFKKVKLETDLSRLTANEQKMIPILIEISKIMDDLFWKQNFGDKEKFLSGLNDDYEKQFALINYGPWDQLNDEKPFIQGFGDIQSIFFVYIETVPLILNCFQHLKNERYFFCNEWYLFFYCNTYTKLSIICAKIIISFTQPDFIYYITYPISM